MASTKESQRKFYAWRYTEIGSLFEKYDAATGNAWVTDQTSESPRRVAEAWEKQRAAKKEFLDALTAATGVPHPYSD